MPLTPKENRDALLYTWLGPKLDVDWYDPGPGVPENAPLPLSSVSMVSLALDVLISPSLVLERRSFGFGRERMNDEFDRSVLVRVVGILLIEDVLRSPIGVFAPASLLGGRP